MSSELSFQDLMARVRAGESDAVGELIVRYGDAIMRAARMRMFNSRLRRAFGSEDVFQSVVKSFCLRYARDENDWKIDTPAELTNLLATMTQNKVTSKVRSETALRRGGGRDIKPIDGPDIPGKSLRPDDELAIKEEYEKYWKLFDQDARALYLMRFDAKLSWDEIGAVLGSSGDACRKKMERIITDVRKQSNRTPNKSPGKMRGTGDG
jgi:DNA-directed RNA polymerase specialized sigma24 family protein